MSTAASTGNQTSPLKTLAYASAIISGGVVGADYATWLKVNPLVGTILGSILSSILTSILLHLQEDPGGKIQETLTKLGAFSGMLIGVTVGISDNGGFQGFFGGLIIGAVLGAMAGQMIASSISFGAFAMLFVSRGPVGMFLRNVMLDGGEANQVSKLDPEPQCLGHHFLSSLLENTDNLYFLI